MCEKKAADSYTFVVRSRRLRQIFFIVINEHGIVDSDGLLRKLLVCVIYCTQLILFPRCLPLIFWL